MWYTDLEMHAGKNGAKKNLFERDVFHSKFCSALETFGSFPRNKSNNTGKK